MTPEIREIASGLKFPEGPIALPGGDVLLVEIARGTLSRVSPDGRVEVVAHTGGGPNGAAMGPDGKVYVCNNGGFEWIDMGGGRLRPAHQPHDYSGGRIERVDLANGRVEVLYTHGPNGPLRGPNDLVSPTSARPDRGTSTTARCTTRRPTARRSSRWCSRC